MKIEIDRVLGRLDRLLAAKDYSAAEAHLKYWLGEAEACGDKAARLTVLNELMGFYRRGGSEESARRYAQAAIEGYGSDNDFCNTVFFATTCLNAATVYKAFGEPERALPLYERCRSIYDRKLEPDDVRYGGLYNNMGLALAELGRVDEARSAFDAAISVQEPFGSETALDRAITWLNICDLEEAENSEAIDSCIEKAYELIIDPSIPRDAYYAFVCEKCAPVFGFYGYFIYEKELSEEAGEINKKYERI
ncbi:MAG: tetratricopeptide repeat protein [Clostridia bacterium]|nr:tetratricopeptide repeat protein [Clostridia bacterium]